MACFSTFNSTLDGNGGVGFVSQLDKTQLITEFECTAFGTSKSLLYIPSFYVLTMEDELMFKRSQTNPLKSIVWINEVKYDLRKLLKGLQDGRGELSTSSAIFTAEATAVHSLSRICPKSDKVLFSLCRSICYLYILSLDVHILISFKQIYSNRTVPRGNSVVQKTVKKWWIPGCAKHTSIRQSEDNKT